jgi:hypothetical protein
MNQNQGDSGIPDDSIGEENALAAGFFNTLAYRVVNYREDPSGRETCSSNKRLWEMLTSGRHYQGLNVNLRDFVLTEWIPQSPGLYFSSTSQWQEVAQALERDAYYSDAIITNVYDSNDGILLPGGKIHAMLNGVGCLRLGVKYLGTESIYFLGASSTGVVHQGIPLVVREQDYRYVIDAIKNDGNIVADVEGVLQVPPKELAPISYIAAVPRYVLLVKSIRHLHAAHQEDVMVSVGAMYSGRRPTYSGRHPSVKDADAPEMSWTFCSFRPIGGETAVKDAVDWLRGYAIRFSGVPDPAIFSDFDEHYDHFPDSVEFSLKQLFGSDINLELIQKYGKRYGFTINVESFFAGDHFANISNSTIIDRSNVGGVPNLSSLQSPRKTRGKKRQTYPGEGGNNMDKA